MFLWNKNRVEPRSAVVRGSPKMSSLDLDYKALYHFRDVEENSFKRTSYRLSLIFISVRLGSYKFGDGEGEGVGKLTMSNTSYAK